MPLLDSLVYLFTIREIIGAVPLALSITIDCSISFVGPRYLLTVSGVVPSGALRGSSAAFLVGYDRGILRCTDIGIAVLLPSSEVLFAVAVAFVFSLASADLTDAT